MKKPFSVILALLLAPVSTYSLLAVSCSAPSSNLKTTLKAAIIDQLGSLYPNQFFIQEITGYLEDSGFSVTLISGDQINVDFYLKLPTYGYKLIIFRVHSTLIRGKEPLTGTTYLFTSEPYSKSKYVSQQLAEMVVPTRVGETSPQSFAVSSKFMSEFTQGQYNQSVIIMMGCNSLYSTDMSEAFISRGALLYTGWTANVKLDFVDDFTMALIKNLCVKGSSFKEALYRTAGQKGATPHKAVFSYYPSENENYDLLGLK